MKKTNEAVKITCNIIATFRDAKTGKILRVYKHKNTVQLPGRAVIARRLANNTAYSGILNYGSLYTAGPAEHYRKLAASYAYDDAAAKAYVSWFFTAAEVSGTFVQWANWIDGSAGLGTGQEWTRVAVAWTKSISESLTIDCSYMVVSS